MAKNYEDMAPTEMRRKDRAKDEEWIKEYLHKADVASIATLHGDQPFINMNVFAYDEENNCIYFHTAKEGRTRYNIGNHTKVCFSIGKAGRFLPADVALEFSVEYKSVVVFGRASIIENDEEAKTALQSLNDKYFPHLEAGKDYREIIPEELKRTTAFKIEIDQWSGKQKVVEEDFPGAFVYPIKK